MTLKRRTFVVGLGSLGLGAGLGGVSHLLPLESPKIGPDWSPGEETFLPSTCLLCPSHCGIVGRVVDGRLVRIDGNPLHPISRGGLCPRGRAGSQLLYHPARLRGPLRRDDSGSNASFSPVSWDAALEQVATALRARREQGRSDRVAWLVGDVQGSVGDVIDRFADAFGTRYLLRESYDDGSSEVMRLCQGVSAQPSLDFERADLVLSFGAALSEAWWCLPQASRARDRPPERRCRWVQVDTRLSRTAVAADGWLAIRPDSYGLLALSIAYVLLKEGLYDAEWIHEGVTGFDDWTDRDGRRVPGYRSLTLRYGSPEEVAPRIGVGVQQIVNLAKDFGRSERPLAVWDQNVSWRRGGLSDALAIHALNVLTGALERPGGVYVQAPLPIRSLGELTSVTLPAPDESAADGSSQDSDWIERLLAAGDPPIEVLFLYYSNPLASAPDPQKVLSLFQRIPMVVSFSPFLDETARAAHLVLPDHTYLERWQDAAAPPSAPYPVWGLVQPIVSPLHDTRATGDVVLDLASRVGGPLADALPWSTMKELIEARGKDLAEVHQGGTFASKFRHAEMREMAARGWWLPHGQDPTSFWNSIRQSGGWFDPFFDDRGLAAASRHPDGRVRLFPEEARRRISSALPEFVEGILPLRDRDGVGAVDGADSGELRLMPYRVMTLASGMTPLMPWLMENLGSLGGVAWEPWVEIHPDTARECGLESVSRVRVASEHGSFTARLRLFHGSQPGLVYVPYGLHSHVDGWGTFEAVNPLVAVGHSRDPVTGLPDWFGTRVRMVPQPA